MVNGTLRGLAGGLIVVRSCDPRTQFDQCVRQHGRQRWAIRSALPPEYASRDNCPRVGCRNHDVAADMAKGFGRFVLIFFMLKPPGSFPSSE